MEEMQVKHGTGQSYYLFIVFLYFFLLKEWAERVVGFLGFADELIALFGIVLFFLRLKRNHGKVLLRNNLRVTCIVVFLSCGLISNIYYKYQPLFSAAIPDVLICLKFWLCIYVGRYTFKKFDYEKYANKIYFHIKFITFVYTFLIILDNIYPIFKAELRYGLRATHLFYGHAFVFASCCALLLTLLLLIQNHISRTGFLIYSIVLSVLMCTTLRSRALGCVLLYWIIYYLVFVRKKKFTLKMLILFVPVVLAVGWNQIEYYFFSDIQLSSARYHLLTKSIQIANDYFPLGSGFATFGSYYSSVIYSPLYSMYGMSNVHGLVEGNAWFVNDSYWSMVLGQFGWLGFGATIIAVYTLFKESQKQRKYRLQDYAACLFIIAYLVIESTASSAFVHPLSMPLALLLGNIFGKPKSDLC